MKDKPKYTGFAIALAWPETYCKQPGSWYDPVTLWMGINENNFYKVGHAAVVLADMENRKFHYFDFGRYHAPYGHGRVRSGKTDHDLIIHTTPEFTKDHQSIKNFDVLLTELQNNISCHGEGALWASYTPIDFRKAFSKANQMQQISPIPYGPFVFNGSNCSRFVNTVIRAGIPDLKYKLRLKYRIPFTPTPKSNVNALDQKIIIPKLLKTAPFSPIEKLPPQLLNGTLPAPGRPSQIPLHAQWLSGEGAGSWFIVDMEQAGIKVTRYSPGGIIECTNIYDKPNEIKAFQDDDSYRIVHPSHCKQVTIKSQKAIHTISKAKKPHLDRV